LKRKGIPLNILEKVVRDSSVAKEDNMEADNSGQREQAYDYGIIEQNEDGEEIEFIEM
jgi:hypothetical protein